MINSLSLRNFQSHKSSTLEFSSGVNVIIGQSDSGKTALLRALNWIITNRPSGDSFRSSWGGDTVVDVRLDSSVSTISRAKTARENAYYITNEDDDRIQYKAMGQGVPDDIIKLLNLNAVNIQGQMDSPFLLSVSAGEVAQTLNEVVGLEDIDRAVSAANRMVNSAKAAKDAEAAQINKLQVDLQQFEQLDELDGMLTYLEDTSARAARLRSQEAELNRLILTASEAQDQLSKIKPLTELQSELNTILVTDKKAEELAMQTVNLETLIENLTSAQTASSKILRTVELESEVNGLYAKYDKSFNTDMEIGKLMVFIEDASSILVAYDEAKNTIRHSGELDAIIKKDEEAEIIHKQITKLDGYILQAQMHSEELTKTKSLIYNMVDEYKIDMGSECPLCGQNVPE